ncbi:MAG: Ig-like domain-containing protein [Alteromonadaceae bacterium]|nr:Ig-like domain-containing protein [Alteromonadaceae bacterium]
MSRTKNVLLNVVSVLMLLQTAGASATYVKGFIDGVGTSIDNFYVSGWACQTEYNQSIRVHLYANGAAGTGKYVASTLASNSSEAGISNSCDTTYNKHRYKLNVSKATAYKYRGQSVYMHGISVAGTVNNQLTHSGRYSFPDFPTSTVTGHLDAIYQSGSDWYARGWACQKYDTQSVVVKLYANNSTSLITSVTTNYASISSVSTACGTSGAKHNFRVKIPQNKLAQFEGAKVYAYASSTLGTGTKMLYQSGSHSLPSSNSPPTVSVTSPVNNEWFTSDESITVSASANDSDGTVSRVEFKLDSGSWESDSTSPYSKSYSAILAGAHTVCARARDNDGAYSGQSCRNFKVMGFATLSSPIAGASLESGAPCFSWQPAEGATHYTIQLSSDSAFRPESKQWVNIDLTSTNVCWGSDFVANSAAGSTPLNLTPGSTYFWRIKAIAANHTATTTTSNGNFTISAPSGGSENERKVIFIHTDLLGSPIVETDEQGSVYQ